MARYLFFPACCMWLAIATEAAGQSVPAERKITHREQSLKPYDPFSAEELFKKIAIPPSQALSPAEALKSFQVAPGFKIECVAHEPLVEDPVMFEFDPDGRIWVVEMRGWMLDVDGSGEGDPIGRVVVLEDVDGDTFYEKSTVFLDGLVMPRTVSFVQGGVLVAEPPNLWYCRDTDGDLKCDDKKRVGSYGKPGNPEHTDNGLFHAMDGWMYNAKSTVRHRFVDGKLIEEPTAFRGQWGMTQDDVGRLFYNYENSSLHADLIPYDYVKRNKNLQPPLRGRAAYNGLNVNLGIDAHEVFPIRVTPGITLGGTELREDGTLKSFTIACGPTIYRGDQFPEQYRGTAIIPEAGGNLVRMDLIEGDGVHLKVRNAFDRRELVASTDERFRPVCARTGPDGALYVCDLYRGIIEHVIFMMPYLKNQILKRGLENPVHKGRIYRITYEGRPLAPVPKLANKTLKELIEHLSHPNGSIRDTAQRLIVERYGPKQDGEVTKPDRATRQVLFELPYGKTPLGTVQGLRTLEALDPLVQVYGTAGAPHMLSWATDKTKDDRVRVACLRRLEQLLRKGDGKYIVLHLERLIDDESTPVLFQLLFTFEKIARLDPEDGAGRNARDAIRKILVRNPTDLFRAAALAVSEGQEWALLLILGRGKEWTAEHERSCGAIEVLATALGNERDPENVLTTFDVAGGSMKDKPWVTEAIIAGLSVSEEARARWPTPIMVRREPELLKRLASNEATIQQAAVLRKIVTWPGDTTLRPKRPVLGPLTADQEKRRTIGEAVYGATCFACHGGDGRGRPGQAPPLVDSEWVNGSLDRLVRIVCDGVHGPITVNDEPWNLKMPGLGHNPLLNDERLAGVLMYVRRTWDNYGSAVEPAEVAAIRRQSAGRSTPWTAEELLDPTKHPAPDSTVDADPLAKYRPLLDGGDAERGRVLFHTNREIRCNACHKVGESGGGFVGPELTEVAKRGPREYLLESLIDPSAKIAKGFETVVIITEAGQIVTGTFVSDDGKQVTIAPPTGGKVTVAVADVSERLTSPVSSMPPMGNAFKPEQIADLVAYLETLKGASPQAGAKP